MNSDSIHERLDYLNQENENIKIVLSQILQNQFIQNPNICQEIYQDVNQISKNVNETNKIMKLDYKDLNKEIRQEWKDLKQSQDEFLKTTTFVSNLAQSALTEIDVLFNKRKRQIDEYFTDRKKKYERLETKAKGFQTMYQNDLKELVSANNSDRALRESNKTQIDEFKNNQNEIKEKLMENDVWKVEKFARLDVLEQRIKVMEEKNCAATGGLIATQPMNTSSTFSFDQLLGGLNSKDLHVDAGSKSSVPTLDNNHWNFGLPPMPCPFSFPSKRSRSNADMTAYEKIKDREIELVNDFVMNKNKHFNFPSKRSRSNADINQCEKIDWEKAGFTMKENKIFQFGDKAFSQQKTNRWSSGSSNSTTVQSFSYELYNN